MGYTAGCHTISHHRYHIVWTPKDRHKVLRGEMRERVRAIVHQVCKKMGVTIVYMFVEMSPHIAVSRFVHRVKGRSSRNSSTGVSSTA